MLQFPPQDGVEVYVSETGLICFKSTGDIEYTEKQLVCLTIGQFRSVIKNSNTLIADAQKAKTSLKEGE
jgi:hypothetical protein